MDSSSPDRHLSARLEVYSPVNDKKESTMEVKRVGIDLAKNVFQLHGVDRHDLIESYVERGPVKL